MDEKKGEQDKMKVAGLLLHFSNMYGLILQAEYQEHLKEVEEVKAGMPLVCVNHDGQGDGPTVKDIRMENFNISVGGRDLIVDGSVTLSYGRHYGMLDYLIEKIDENSISHVV